jgi:hypothetical protein
LGLPWQRLEQTQKVPQSSPLSSAPIIGSAENMPMGRILPLAATLALLFTFDSLADCVVLRTVEYAKKACGQPVGSLEAGTTVRILTPLPVWCGKPKSQWEEINDAAFLHRFSGWVKKDAIRCN